jgi:DNA-binding winged helix-turn-helix (wHTH) protein/predicted ATPase
MQPGKDVTFGRFRLDPRNECLWQGNRAIALRPKAFAVLRLLVEHSGQLVTKQLVLDTVWPGTFVGDAVLKDCVRQLRDALGDDAESPTYIETAHRRGYRFIGKFSRPAVGERPEVSAAHREAEGKPDVAGHSISEVAGEIHGRETELECLRSWLQRAVAGERHIVFVTGEAGIGKTTLVQAFLARASEVRGIQVASGQCLEHYGAGEAYMPVLDAFSRLSRSQEGEHIVDVLRQHAPAWLTQMPSLLSPSEREALNAQMHGASRERMLREMAETLELLSAEAPLILVLEDLHWSDHSTLDLISYLARRRDPSRLMLIGTYRPVEVILDEHPLKGVKRELQAHGLCKELPLAYLSEEATAEYLSARFPRHELSRRLARMIHRRTEGNPLFMVNVVQYLVDENIIVEDQGKWKLGVEFSQAERGVPENLRQLIEKQIERLSPDEHTVLEAASVVGMECSAVAIAAGLDRSTEWVEQHCEELARRHQFLSPAWLVELPDGTMTARHRFNHILYLEVPYSLVPQMRRSQIHHRIAERGVAVYGDRVSEIAGELAMHFEQSRDWPRALHYLIQAAENATSRSAHREATELAKRGLEVLNSLPETRERAQQEITLRMILSVSLMAVKGFTAAEVEKVSALGKEVLWSSGPSPRLFNMLYLVGLFHMFNGEMQSALEVAGQLLELAGGLKEPALVMEAHRSMGVMLLELGRGAEALEHLDRACGLYPAHHNHPYTLTIGHDCKVVSECFAARALWALGYPDAASRRMQEALAFARELSHPSSWVFAAHFASQLHQFRGEPLLAHERATEVLSLADEYGLELWLAFGSVDLGWAEVELGQIEEGIKHLRHGLAGYQATGGKVWRPHFLGVLAMALSKAGATEEAIRVVQEALTLGERTGESYAAPELYRLKGELMMRAADQKPLRAQGNRKRNESAAEGTAAAEACFAEGLKIARKQGAKSWELRLLTSRDSSRQGNRRGETRPELAEIYSWFTEGHETADLKRAATLLVAPLRA